MICPWLTVLTLADMAQGMIEKGGGLKNLS